MKNRKGFTMIELLVAVAIMGVLTIIAIPSVKIIQANNRKTKYMAYEKSIKAASKLYTDSFEEDLFGATKTGCTTINYSELKEKDLIQDIQLDDTKCDNDEETFVFVIKDKDKNHNYFSNIVCRNGSQVVYSNHEGYREECAIEDGEGPNIDLLVSPKQDVYYRGEKPIITITISDSGIGLKARQKLSYQWFKNDVETSSTPEPKTIRFNNKNYEGTATKEIPLPEEINEVDEPAIYKLVITGTVYDVDLNDTSAENVNESLNYFVGALFIMYKANDGKMVENEHGAAYSIDSDYIVRNGTEKELTKIKYGKSTKLLAYNDKDNINLRKQNNYIDQDKEWIYNGKEFSQNDTLTTDSFGIKEEDLKMENITITVAANWKSNAVNLTYDDNGGTGCSDKGVTRNKGEKWNSICTPTRTNYIFDGWNIEDSVVQPNELSEKEAKEDTNAQAVWKGAGFSITYKRNTSANDTTEKTESKDSGASYSIASNPWTNSGKTFIGWATVANATATSGTWYDPGQSYTNDANLTLYAQWYDVSSLEQAYTTYVQSGDLTDNHETAYRNKKLGKGDVTSVNNSFNGKAGIVGISGIQTSNNVREYITEPSKATIRSQFDTVNADVFQNYLSYVKRSAKTYPNENIDDRIDRLQKINTVALKYSDFNIKHCPFDNKSVTYKTTTTWGCNPETGYKMISAAGVSTNNASSKGQKVEYCYTSHLAMGDDVRNSAVYPNTSGYVRVIPAYKNITSKIKIESDFLQVKILKASTTTFAPKSNKGLSRYKALAQLNSAKSTHFPASYFKTTKVTMQSCGSLSGWGKSCLKTKSISIPNGIILGVVGWSITGTKNPSVGLVNQAKLNSITMSKTNSVTSRYFVGNKYYDDSSAETMDGVHMDLYIRYISSGSLSSS